MISTMWAFNLDIVIIMMILSVEHLISPRHNHLYCVDDVATILIFCSLTRNVSQFQKLYR